MALTYIYSLNCPITNTPKYIGKADDLEVRYKGHLHENRNDKKCNWVKSLKNQGLKPIIEEIDKIPEIEWEFWERHYISLYRSWRFDLKNGTDGGEGQSKGFNPSRETREKLSELGKLGNKGQFKKGSQLWKGKKHSEKAKLKMREKKIGHIPWNKGLKGVMPIPWNKNKKLSIEHTDKIKQSKLKKHQSNLI